ncbi:hypothetical protein [Vibrio sp. WXL103]|uniref:hypothetical protein n=1 Tax=unclassified Vibrio TaxID=2614977 RepID=UPI003EC76AC9
MLPPKKNEQASLGALYNVINDHAEGIRNHIDRERSLINLIDYAESTCAELVERYEQLKHLSIPQEEITPDNSSQYRHQLVSLSKKMPIAVEHIDEIKLIDPSKIDHRFYSVFNSQAVDLLKAEREAFKRLNVSARSISDFEQKLDRHEETYARAVELDAKLQAQKLGQRKGVLATLAASLAMGAFFFHFFVQFA